MSSALSVRGRAAEVRAALEGELEPQALQDASGRLVVDEMEPELVVQPVDEYGVTRTLAEAAESRAAVIVAGSGSRLGLGNAPEAYDIALSLAQLDGVVAFEPDDLTITVQPGVRLRELRALLDQHERLLPLDPPGDDTTTVGGMVAANAHGPMRHAFGTARDWLIGVRVVHAGGVTAKAGGRVVKNVTGYDMMKLYCGSLGSLGAIVECAFKLAPRPRFETPFAIACRSARDASAAVLDAWDAGLALHAAEVLSPPAAHRVLGVTHWCVLGRAAGGRAAVDRTLRDLSRAATRNGGDLQPVEESCWSTWKAAFAPGPLNLRCAVQPAQVAEAAEVLDRRFTGAAPLLSATVSAGVIRAALEPGRIRSATLVTHAHEVVARRGGSVVVESAPVSLKRQIDVFGALRPDFLIMKRLKDELDPHGIMSPGRFVGRI